MKKNILFTLCLALAACGGGEDDSKPAASTYNSCRISSSQAFFASDRANDLAQCWSITQTTDKTNALTQCSVLTSKYMTRYISGHSYEYIVSSSACPSK